MSSRNLYTFIGLVVFISLAIVIGIYIGLNDTKQPELLKEIAKSFLQLGTLGTLGALVKYAIDQISLARERRNSDREFKKELLSQLRDIHQTIRIVPYLIEQDKSVTAYNKHMLKLLEARATLTDIRNEIKTSDIGTLKKCGVELPLKKMMRYLSVLLRESVESNINSWDVIKALPNYCSYRNATLKFSGSKIKSTPYGLDYDTHYEDSKKILREALKNIS